jgi:hypothetical protein
MARQIATIRYKTVNNRVVFNDGLLAQSGRLHNEQLEQAKRVAG